MRTVIVVVLCTVVGACGWTNKRGGGTNIDPQQQGDVNKRDHKRL